MRRILILMLTGWLILVAASCSTAHFTKLWMDPTYDSHQLGKIMVIALRNDQVERRMWEDAFVSAVDKQDTSVSVVPSYRLFPNQIPPPDSVEIVAKSQEFEGILVVAEVVLDTMTSQGPGYTTTEEVTKRKHRTYVTRLEEVYHPGETDTTMAVSVQTDLFLPLAAEGQLVWSGTSQSIDPTSPEEFRSAVAGAVAKQLSKEGLIP